jgi:hypothetical protein
MRRRGNRLATSIPSSLSSASREPPNCGPWTPENPSTPDIRAFIADQAEAVEAGELAAKTVNNALVTLVVCLNDAVEDGLIVANPALRVDRLPAAHIEREYLRLHEIPIYLDSCSQI